MVNYILFVLIVFMYVNIDLISKVINIRHIMYNSNQKRTASGMSFTYFSHMNRYKNQYMTENYKDGRRKPTNYS